MRRLNFTSTYNTRDLGGYPLAGGGYTRYGRFFRSDVPASLLDTETDYLRQHHIHTIVDLRSPEECERTPCFLADKPGFSYHHCPMLVTFSTREEEVPVNYLKLFQDTAVVHRMMALFADTDTAVLYHCAAGKDRTGVVSALLLALAGVPMVDILADYEVSYTYVRPKVHQLHKDHPSIPAWVGRSKPKYLEGFFAAFLEEHRSVENYLLHIGLSQGQIGAIRSKLAAD